MKINQKHWIGVTPMEAELTTAASVPGLAPLDARVGRARRARERLLQRRAARTTAGCSTPAAAAGRPVRASARSSRSTAAIQAVGEGNYGRLGAEQQRRYTDANAEPMFSEPATGGTPDEQPGAMPEIMPSPDSDAAGPRRREHRPLLDVPVDVHAGVGPLRHGLAGRAPAARRAPDLGRAALTVVPQLPSTAPIAGRDIRLGDGALELVARRATAVATHDGR